MTSDAKRRSAACKPSALGMEKSAPRVEQAAGSMVDAAAGIADEVTAAFSDAKWGREFGAKVEAAMGDTTIDTSNRDLLGQQRVTNGELTQSTVLLAAIVSELRALRAQAGKGGSAVGATASRRQTAELGAF